MDSRLQPAGLSLSAIYNTPLHLDQTSLADTRSPSRNFDEQLSDSEDKEKPRSAGEEYDNHETNHGTAHTSSTESEDLEKQLKHAHDPHEKDPNQPKLPFGQRLRHFTWAWYTLTMSTGGVATLISVQPHAFKGLISIGAAFFVFNLVLFAIVTTTMIVRFCKFPGSMKASLTHDREGLFFPTFWLTIATILTGAQKYIVQPYDSQHQMRVWLTTTLGIAFWAYTILTFLLAVFQYSFLFARRTYELQKMMPSWLLPVFPVMLSGTIASVIAADQTLASRLPIIVAGVGCQGLGFSVSVIMYAHYIGRLMQSGLPNREHRPGMFIGVGPPSFTALAFIGMANSLPVDFDFNSDKLLDGALVRTLALLSALFLWVLAMWFFMIAAVAVLCQRPKYFHLGWWAMVFPNTGFVLATIQIGNTLNSQAIQYVANGLTVLIVLMWIFVLYHHIRAVIVSDIMYPGRDEDYDD